MKLVKLCALVLSIFGCTQCSGMPYQEQTTQILDQRNNKDIFCVRGAESRGIRFIEAVSGCSDGAVLLDFTNAPDLQEEAVITGYYSKSDIDNYAASTSAREARYQALIRRGMEEERERQAAQGSQVRHLSQAKCSKIVLGVPNYVAPLGPYSSAPGSSIDSPFLTTQENWCMALGRSQESPADNRFPGILPDGARATYLGDGHWSISY